MKIVTSFSAAALLSLASMAVACTAQTEPPTGPNGQQTSPVNGQPVDPTPAPTTSPAPAPAPAPAPTMAPAPAPAPVAACTPLAAPNGSSNPAAVYCAELGYQLAGEQCTFPDATSCEQWSFYRGECGQTHSFCNLHGGTVANKVEDMGSWTASYALCTLPTGKQCHEDAFARSCSCE